MPAAAPPPPADTKPQKKSAPAPASQGKTEQTVSSSVIGVARGAMTQGEKIGIYGPGGIGKTELVASLQQVGIDPLFIDLDQGTSGLDVARATTANGELVYEFTDVRAALQNRELTDQFDAVVIDTFSALEDRCREWVIANVPHEKRDKVINRIEDYGFGKGLTHIFETALFVLQDLDALVRRGKHAVIVCHQCTEKVPSADVEEYLEYQPRLQSPPKTGKLRERVFEWSNHFFRIDHDRNVQDGRATNGDVRTIHTVRTTTAWAKHRTMPNGREFPNIIPYTKGSYELWEIMFGQ